MIAVLVEVEGEPAPLRHYFAVGTEDQQRAEWAAVDAAQKVGHVATSPLKGQEPVEAIRRLAPPIVASMGLRPGQVQAFGWKWPRRWLGSVP